MRTFHNDPAIKALYLDRIASSLKAGRLSIWADWSADFWFPTAMTLDDEDADICAYRDRLGLPEWLAVLEDGLWLVMPQDRGSTWLIDFLTAIPVGVTEERLDSFILAPFMLRLLQDGLLDLDRSTFPQIEACLHAAIRLWERDDLFSHRWLTDAARMGETALAAIPNSWDAATYTPGWLAMTALPEPDAAPWCQIEAAMQSLNPSRADAYAEDIVHRLQSLSPPRRTVSMLDAVRAAS